MRKYHQLNSWSLAGPIVELSFHPSALQVVKINQLNGQESQDSFNFISHWLTDWDTISAKFHGHKNPRRNIGTSILNRMILCHPLATFRPLLPYRVK